MEIHLPMKRKDFDASQTFLKKQKKEIIQQFPSEIWTIIFSFFYKSDFMKIRILSKSIYKLPWKQMLSKKKFILNYEKYKLIDNDFSYVTYLYVRSKNSIQENHMKKIRCIPKLDFTLSPLYAIDVEHLLSGEHKIQKLELKSSSIGRKSFTYLSGIKKLNLSFCVIPIEQFSSIKGVETLKLIHFKGKNDDFKHLIGIKSLSLIMCENITDEGFQYLKGINKLNIDINSSITDKAISYINGVKSLSLNNCQNITSSCLQYLEKIEKLEINDNIRNIDSGMIYLKGIKSLTLSDSDITDKSFFYLKSLTFLSLNNCRNFSSEAFKFLENLEGLKIGICPNVKNDDFKYLKNLKHLYLVQCELINDECLKYVPKLEELNCTSIEFTDQGISSLAHLKKLSIFFCNNITGKGIISKKLTEFLYTQISINDLFEDNPVIFSSLAHFETQNLFDKKHLKFLKGIRIIDISFMRNLTFNDLKELVGSCIFIGLSQITLEEIENLKINFNVIVKSMSILDGDFKKNYLL